MFKKILIANRGEIAVRVIKTCRKLGIKTVAIYSEADKDSPHVEQADEAYLVGGPRVNESYINIERVIEIAMKSKVEAIHPGYGLLSENELFARKCQENKIVFIGPTPDIIGEMGSKIRSRILMEKAGVPIIPGTSYPVKNADEAKEAAKLIGYPLMLKASAGGGGIGMELVSTEEQLLEAFEGNKKRAENFFGDGSMFIEKFIDDPRHIEIQILGDKYNNTVYLWDRECSIQRRHQKVLEEAPSNFLDDITREKMGEVAVKAAKAIGYHNAGTVEFIVDKNKKFYFLEMNTRLQVEHPVTEEITGIDLVEQQINIAYGKKLSFKQEDIKLNGHAIEVRIYAEDPNTFYPSPGKINRLSVPQGKGIRNELAVQEGSIVSPFYDPMIAKLIVHSGSRQNTIYKLKEALSKYTVEGIKTNIPLLLEVLNHNEFIDGNTTTKFIEKHLKQVTSK
ncbi:acetyl-CoA carboxylase biotin carboxylase subunit [Oceanobacillus halophilus]|uniref:biotin carboxylase n=1 Tax=Oceanobacillus halophilus TaxID=930130 RepID=A0A495A8Z6_9BACI|nr:acetyl-CoA carboxylase biotin carboxylase subunit [Oceanobacillus halophilus]RKQ35765.1 acetyl-CoA carboxylase biotin carboxylase subunit [Oceanobacillus halophilus]